MKPYNEQEYNQLCVDFIELKCHEPSGYWTLPTFMDGDGWTMNDMKFHSDWNWIMEVVEKIEHIKKYSIGIDSHPSYGTNVLIQHAHINGVYDLVIKESTHWNKKEAVIQSIWQFLNWYNEQKQ
jgi:hypothetical protein